MGALLKLCLMFKANLSVQSMLDVQDDSEQGHSDYTVCTAQVCLSVTSILLSLFGKKPLLSNLIKRDVTDQ